MLFLDILELEQSENYKLKYVFLTCVLNRVSFNKYKIIKASKRWVSSAYGTKKLLVTYTEPNLRFSVFLGFHILFIFPSVTAQFSVNSVPGQQQVQQWAHAKCEQQKLQPMDGAVAAAAGREGESAGSWSSVRMLGASLLSWLPTGELLCYSTGWLPI